MAPKATLETLPAEIQAEILKQLPLRSLCALERTSKAMRRHLAANSHLGYTAPDGNSYVDPVQATGHYGLHVGFERILHQAGHRPRMLIRRGYERDDIQKMRPYRMVCLLRDTSMYHNPATQPALSRLTLRIGSEGCLDEVKHTMGHKDGEPITVRDIFNDLVHLCSSSSPEKGKIVGYFSSFEHLSDTEFKISFVRKDPWAHFGGEDRNSWGALPAVPPTPSTPGIQRKFYQDG